MEKDARELLLKYHQGQATAEEKAMLENWLHNFNAEIEHGLSDEQLQLAHQQNWAAIKPNTSKPSIPLWKKLSIAASILLCLSLAFYFYSAVRPVQLVQTTKTSPIAPGGNKAFLTLSNGQKISLTDATNGKLAEQSGIQITKTATGMLVYQLTDQPNPSGKTSYNTIETPKGGQYQLILPDGSKVWLNAASTLTFPTSFASLKTRKVELIGEAYFEIAKNKTSPFIVKSAKQEVKVLGTHFNINSYADEQSTTTTLLEGSVNIVSLNRTENVILKPGQQSTLNNNKINVTEINTEEAIAWKNGLFIFNDENIKSIMKKIARWYNVEITFKGNLDHVSFVGNYARNKDLESLLENIELTEKVHFKIEGRRIEVIAK
ncbi:FecR family protein [Pedobacter sp. ok626]|uniref:FecR family protein n=1 Tax=Pedobacter sp. ok626 TaxID=1761882 RepID=UPI0008823F0A|nr:FecR family protein [Pedobacter sp. ok626]SDK93427.1 FecR family protein [Pedobacter sp. ok626]